MQRLRTIQFTALLVFSMQPSAANPATELNWSSVHLEGMTLQLVSPKAKGDSEELHFGKGTMSATYCSGGMCTGPLTVWKIENNRLKVGYAPTEGDVLVEFTAKKLVLRHPDGKVFVYSIISQSGT